MHSIQARRQLVEPIMRLTTNENVNLILNQ